MWLVFTIFTLTRGKKSIQKTLTETGDSCGNTLMFNHINSTTKHLKSPLLRLRKQIVPLEY
jgi:hypothetical protein